MLKAAADRYLRMLVMSEKKGNEFYFSPAHVIDRCGMMEQFRHHEDGQWLFTQIDENGDPDPSIILEPWQIWIESAIHGFRLSRTGERLVRIALEITPRKSGKALALDTPIPTPTGWTTMGAVRVGDMVIGADGRPARVVEESPVFIGHDCYRITFSNGEQIVADADHRWLTTARVDTPGRPKQTARKKGPTLTKRMLDGRPCWFARFWKTPEVFWGYCGVDDDAVKKRFEEASAADLEATPIEENVISRVRTTEEIFKTQFYGTRRDRNHSISMPAPIAGEWRHLPLDPYILGAWIGDGASNSSIIHAGRADADEMAKRIRSCGVDVDLHYARTSVELRLRPMMWESGLFAVSSMGGRPTIKSTLAGLGVLKNKHIPHIYLRASVEQRLALLQGMMDTDGSIDKGGRNLTYVTISPLIRDGFAELLASLGIKFSVTEKKSICNGRDIQKPNWRFQFSTTRDLFPVFRMKRKLERMLTSGDRAQRSRTVQIVSVEPVPSVPTKCIAVDNESHLFLCGRTMLPTHNTQRLAINAIVELCIGGDSSAQIPIAAESENQADKTLFGAIIKILNNDPSLMDEFKLKKTAKMVTCGASRIFKLLRDGEKEDGLNPTLALFEEGHSGHASVYKVVRSAFGAKPNALIRMISTAGYRPEGPAYELLKDAEKILLGKHQDYRFFAAVYSLDPEDYLHPETNAIMWGKLLSDETLVAKANPMYGISLTPENIRDDMREAERKPDFKAEIARTRFNIWTGEGKSLISYVSWMDCKSDVVLGDFIGKKCWIGVDLADSKDMCAISLMFEDGKDIAVFSTAFLPRLSETLTDPNYGDQFRAWSEEGRLILTEGASSDLERVEDEIRAYCEVFDVQAIAFDPYQARNVMRHLWDDGLPVLTYPNSARNMTFPFDDLQARIADKKIKHDGNTLLAWCASNVHGERRGNGSIMPRKESVNSRRKIDCFMAVCFANGVRLVPEFAKKSFDDAGPEKAIDPYAARGLIGYEERSNV